MITKYDGGTIQALTAVAEKRAAGAFVESYQPTEELTRPAPGAGE